MCLDSLRGALWTQVCNFIGLLLLAIKLLVPLPMKSSVSSLLTFQVKMQQPTQYGVRVW